MPQHTTIMGELFDPPEHGKGVLGDLQIDSDIAYSHREWAAERIAWVVMALVLAVGLAGFFGSGPVAWGVAESEGGLLRVDYPKYLRFDARVRLSIEARPAAARDGAFEIEISRDYLQDFRVDGLIPEPDSVETSGDTLTYSFAQSPDGGGLAVSFSMAAEGRGRVDATIAVPGDAPVHIDQFIYP